MTGPVLRAQDAAKYVGLSYSRFRQLLCFGEGPNGFKQGRLNVFYPADLDAWLTSRLVPIASGMRNTGTGTAA